uniref:GWxTD domain-containing protein n=1 Tax=Schlesneria paludicola TaxID=360056 RepID=A0A7C2JWK0_9PLAN
MRATIAFSALLLAVIAAAGCTTSGWTWRKSPPSVATNEPASSKPASPTTDKPQGASADKAESPFKSSREKSGELAASETPPKVEAAETKPEVPAKPAAPTDSQTAADGPAPVATPLAAAPERFTIETLKLIDQELRDATPEERAEWYEQLKRVDPAVIPDILRARRLTRQLADANPPPQGIPDSRHVGGPLPTLETVVAPSAVADGSPLAVARDGISPVAYQPTGQATNPAQHAHHQTPQETRPTVEHSVYRYDPQRPQQPLMLQNMEYEPPPGSAAQAPIAPPAATPTPAGNPTSPADPRALPPSSGATPAAIAWPPPKTPATNSNGLSSVVPFGAGFVQNVVGLVPSRGTPNPAGQASPAVETSPAGATSTWLEELERTTAFLEREVAAIQPGTTAEEQAAYVRKHVALRMLYLMGNHQERALTTIPGLPPAEQEFWQQLFWGMSNALDTEHIPQPKDRATQTIAQLNAAMRRLQEQADLQIRNVAFCRQILYFGNYERFPRDEFRPGQEVLLYAEIDNFKSEPTADGQYRTLLRSTLEILSPSGELRKVIDFPATEDLCRNYRRDYFHNYQFVIPDRLPLGPHTLKLTVFDELSGKMCSYSANFVVK